MLHACDDKGLWRCWGEDCCRTNHSNSKYIAETFGTWHFHKEGLVICVRPQSRKSLVRDPGKGTWFIRGGNDDTTTVVSPNVMSSLDVGGWVSAFLAVGRNIKTTLSRTGFENRTPGVCVSKEAEPCAFTVCTQRLQTKETTQLQSMLPAGRVGSHPTVKPGTPCCDACWDPHGSEGRDS